MLKIIDTKKNKAKANMEMDFELLNNLKDDPILHFYDWKEDSLTYGYFIDISKFIDDKKAKEQKLELAKRPTGGGIVFHKWDLAFSFLMPSNHKYFFKNTLENYKFVNSIVLNALKKNLDKLFLSRDEFLNENKVFDNFCMAKPTRYDVIYKGKKIAGSSQRRKKNGYLHQASICLIKPDIDVLKSFLIEKDIAKAIFEKSFPVFLDQNILKNRREIKENLIKEFKLKIS